MNLTNEYYYFNEPIDKKTCSRIIQLGDKGFDESTVGHGGLHEITDKKIRTSKVAWSDEQWVYDLIWPYMEEANELAGWKYDIKGAESIQVAKYEEGSFYNFHKDGKSDNFGAYNTPDNKIKHGNVRKLSISIILNDDYEGGGFQFVGQNSDDQGSEVAANIYTPDFSKAGSVMVFPSFMMHRVESVTKGTRYSLVAWFVGPPFR